jgi:hypothetical protein
MRKTVAIFALLLASSFPVLAQMQAELSARESELASLRQLTAIKVEALSGDGPLAGKEIERAVIKRMLDAGIPAFLPSGNIQARLSIFVGNSKDMTIVEVSLLQIFPLPRAENKLIFLPTWVRERVIACGSKMTVRDAVAEMVDEFARDWRVMN